MAGPRLALTRVFLTGFSGGPYVCSSQLFDGNEPIEGTFTLSLIGGFFSPGPINTITLAAHHPMAGGLFLTLKCLNPIFVSSPAAIDPA